MKLSPSARGFIEGMREFIQKEGKPSLVPKVQELLGKVTAQAQKETVAQVTSSVPLLLEEEKMIERFLYHLIGHPVILERSVDKTLIGGLTIKIGDWVVDTSMRGQLEQMGKAIL